jgi:hypothetical protein
MPSLSDGSGVDTFVATLSAGTPLKVVAAGLLEDVSLESARRLATTTYARVVEVLNLNDRRKQEERIDILLSKRPDVILVAGGTDGGASQSVMRLVEAVGLACYLSPSTQRPEVLYAGNQALVAEVRAGLGHITDLHIAANVRPSLEIEQLEPAQVQLAGIFRSLRCKHLLGAQELNQWAGERMLPTATAFGRIIRFLSKVYDPQKGVLGIDVGASATTVAAAFAGDLRLSVFSDLGLGMSLPGLLNHVNLESIIRWMPNKISEVYIRDYVHNKTLYPATIPVSQEDMALESALTREVIRTAIRLSAKTFPSSVKRSGEGMLPWFEPIVATGSVLTRAPSPGSALLMLLDALQPTGITTLGLDQNNVSAALGAAASYNPILAYQVLESSTLLSLGTVISPISNNKIGTPILRVKVMTEAGEERTQEIKQGNVELVSLPLGQKARLHLQPLHRADVGMGGPGRGGNIQVTGGLLGVVVDCRGRPLRLSADADYRRELHKKWLWSVGG